MFLQVNQATATECDPVPDKAISPRDSPQTKLLNAWVRWAGTVHFQFVVTINL